MRMNEIRVQRLSFVSTKPFDEVVKVLTATIGQPELGAFHAALGSSASFGDFEAVVRAAVGPSELMEFIRFDAGQVLRKESGGSAPKMLRLVVGNPLIMKELAKAAPDAAAYAPVTILVDERPDGVHLSYDAMASLLAPYGSARALAVANELDAKVTTLLDTAAR
jgi:uncharacterized protein (DUF302 family)